MAYQNCTGLLMARHSSGLPEGRSGFQEARGGKQAQGVLGHVLQQVRVSNPPGASEDAAHLPWQTQVKDSLGDSIVL